MRVNIQRFRSREKKIGQQPLSESEFAMRCQVCNIRSAKQNVNKPQHNTDPLYLFEAWQNMRCKQDISMNYRI